MAKHEDLLRHRWEETDRRTSLRSDERSTSPESVIQIPGIGDPHHRNTHCRVSGLMSAAH